MKESVEINFFKELKINRRLLEEFMERLYEGKRYIEVSWKATLLFENGIFKKIFYRPLHFPA